MSSSKQIDTGLEYPQSPSAFKLNPHSPIFTPRSMSPVHPPLSPQKTDTFAPELLEQQLITAKMQLVATLKQAESDALSSMRGIFSLIQRMKSNDPGLKSMCDDLLDQILDSEECTLSCVDLYNNYLRCSDIEVFTRLFRLVFPL